jgi:hypothetical protein
LARRREMASTSLEVRILAIVNCTILGFTLQCSSSRTVKSYIRFFVLSLYLVVVPASCGDLRTGSSGLLRQSMYINDHSVRLENVNDKDASSKVMLSH